MPEEAGPWPEGYELESRPSAEQKQRLQDFLLEMLVLSRRYGMLVTQDPNTGNTVVVDTDNETVVGIDFFFATDAKNDHRVLMYTCESSILDGVWVVESDDGSWTQQRYSRHDWGEPPTG